MVYQFDRTERPFILLYQLAVTVLTNGILLVMGSLGYVFLNAAVLIVATLMATIVALPLYPRLGVRWARWVKSALTPNREVWLKKIVTPRGPGLEQAVNRYLLFYLVVTRWLAWEAYCFHNCSTWADFFNLHYPNVFESIASTSFYANFVLPLGIPYMFDLCWPLIMGVSFIFWLVCAKNLLSAVLVQEMTQSSRVVIPIDTGIFFSLVLKPYLVVIYLSFTQNLFRTYRELYRSKRYFFANVKRWRRGSKAKRFRALKHLGIPLVMQLVVAFSLSLKNRQSVSVRCLTGGLALFRTLWNPLYIFDTFWRIQHQHVGGWIEQLGMLHVTSPHSMREALTKLNAAGIVTVIGGAVAAGIAVEQTVYIPQKAAAAQNVITSKSELLEASQKYPELEKALHHYNQVVREAGAVGLADAASGARVLAGSSNARLSNAAAEVMLESRMAGIPWTDAELRKSTILNGCRGLIGGTVEDRERNPSLAALDTQFKKNQPSRRGQSTPSPDGLAKLFGFGRD